MHAGLLEGIMCSVFGGLNAVKTNFRVFLFVVMYDTFTHGLIVCEVYTATVSL